MNPKVRRGWISGFLSIEWSALRIIFLLLILGRVAVLLAAPAAITGDGWWYVPAAKTLLAGHVPPYAGYPLGFPLLLVPVVAIAPDHVALVVHWVQVAMDGAVIAALSYLVQPLFRKSQFCWPKILFLVAVATQPFTARIVNNVMTEPPSQFLLFFGIWACSIYCVRNRLLPLLIGSACLSVASGMRVDTLILCVFVLGLVVILRFARLRSVRHLIVGSMASVALLGSCSFGLMVLGYLADGRFALVPGSLNPHHSGYYAWMRTWLIETEKQYYSFGLPYPAEDDKNWIAYSAKSFPRQAFNTEAEFETISGLMADWQKNGYADHIDRRFNEVANAKIEDNPLRHFVLIPLHRMGFYWVNFNGARILLSIKSDMPRLTTIIIVVMTFGLSLLFLALAVLGAYQTWICPEALRVPAELLDFGRLASATVVLRTVELGLISPFAGSGLLEARYVTMVWPLLLLSSAFGLSYFLHRVLPTSKVAS